MTIFYFTSTGNSLSVAKRIGGNLISIPQIVDSENLQFKDDVIGVIFPIYAFAPPKMVQRFLNKAKVEADYVFAIGTCGNMTGACMLNLQKRFSFDYVNHLPMVDNYLPMFDVDSEIAKLPKKKTEEMIAKIADDIFNRRHIQATSAFWWRIITPLITNILNITDSKQTKKFTINDQCNKCGVCANVCPAKNITVNDNIMFGNQCEVCLGCLHHCPQNALRMKNEKSNKRWCNPEVSLEEIINANNRNK